MLALAHEEVALEGLEVLEHVADGGVEDAVCAVFAGAAWVAG